MKSQRIINSSIVFIVSLFCAISISANQRFSVCFNNDWLFKLTENPNVIEKSYNDYSWKRVTLPHDWSAEMSFTEKNTGGATAFLPGGFGVYRKHFKLPLKLKDKITRIEFDGIYNNSKVWINGHYICEHPYGYSPFSANLSQYLNFGDKENIIVVTVDRKAYLDCRWYPGSGIYRNVRLTSVDKLNILENGVYITTPNITPKKATINIQTTINNQYKKAQNAILTSSIIDKNNKVVARISSKIEIEKSGEKIISQTTDIENPILWDIDNPSLYRVESKIFSKNNLPIDNTITNFGIRTIKYDTNKGFFLNGKSVKFKGVCLHHDGGLVGAAVPRDVWIRRLKLLKEAGCNAIRTSHNPASSEFLDLCDEMGFLVQAEFFDEFNNPKDKRKNYNQQEADDATKGYSSLFNKWSDKDIQTTMLRDRNRPSIVMWSIGNEIEWTYPEYGVCTGYWSKDRPKDVNYYYSEPPYSQEKIKELFFSQNKNDLGNTAKHLSDIVKSLDKTRPVTANLVMPSVSSFTDYGKSLDILGFSYRAAVYDYCHKLYPDKMIYGSENWVRYNEWKAVEDRDFVAGIFVWTGIYYMGESKQWPKKGSASGMLDFAGFKMQGYYSLKAVWNKSPEIKMFTQLLSQSPYIWDENKKEVVEKIPGWWKKQQWSWHKMNEYWDYNKNDDIVIETYGNCPIAELFLNGESIGKKRLNAFEDRVIKWKVPFKPGKLSIIGYDENGKQIASQQIITPNIPAKIVLKNDKKILECGNQGNVSHIIAYIVDKDNNPIENKEFNISFNVNGKAARVYGVDNGAVDNVQDYNSTNITTHCGKALLIVGQKSIKGNVNITASSNNLKSNSINISIE